MILKVTFILLCIMEEKKGLTGDNKENGPFEERSMIDCTSTRKRVKFDVADRIYISYTKLYERRLYHLGICLYHIFLHLSLIHI